MRVEIFTIITFQYLICQIIMSVCIMMCSAATGQSLKTLTVRMRGIASTDTGLSSSVSTRSSHSILFGENNIKKSMHICYIHSLIQLVIFCIPCSVGDTMGRRLGSILLGWASTQKCCSMLLWLDSSASSMDWRPMMMLSGRE